MTSSSKSLRRIARRATHCLPGLFFALFVIFLNACQRERNVFHRYAAVDIRGWARQEGAEFCFTDFQRPATYDMSVEVRLAQQFPYQDLTLAVSARTQSGTALRDTLTFNLLDEHQQMAGQGHTLRYFCIPLRALSLQPHDTLRVSLRHLLPQETVPGVHDVGILLKPGDNVPKNNKGTKEEP